MKNYETGICVCGKKKKDHYRDTLHGKEMLFCFNSVSMDVFTDSGISRLCDPKVSIKMFEALERIAKRTTDQWAQSVAFEAINEALKRE